MIYEFTPTQDLHGYGKPWAPGAGKNLLDYDTIFEAVANGDGTFTGSTTGEKSIPAIQIPLEDYIGETITYSLKVVDHAAEPNVWYVRGVINGVGNGSSATNRIYPDESVPKNLYQSMTPETEEDFVGLSYGSGVGPITITNLQLELGSEMTSFAPYANICPPEGYDIWDPLNSEMVQVYSGYVDAEARKLYLHPVYEEYDGEELVGPWMSSMDKYTEEGIPTTGAFVVDMGGELIEVDITDFMLQTLLDSLGVRRFITSGAMLLNSLMDQAQGRVRSEEELLNRSLPLHVIAIGDELPTNLIIKKSDVLPGLPGKIKI